MRITNSMLQRGALSQIQSNMQGIAQAQQKVSSGKRLLKASDDPSGASAAMRTRGTLRSVEQYKRNLGVANSRAEAEESTLDSVLNVLARAKEVGVGQGSATANAETRKTAKTEVDQIFEHIVQLANTRFGGDYLFGGTKGDTRPYTIDPTAPQGFTSTSPTGDHQVEIAEGRHLKISHNGVEAFEDTGALAALHRLSKALGDNDTDEITTALGELDTAFGGVQTLIGSIGARVNHLQSAETSLGALELNLETLKSEIEDVHIEEAITAMVGRQTTLQAAMLATSRVMGLSLANYLR